MLARGGPKIFKRVPKIVFWDAVGFICSGVEPHLKASAGQYGI